MHYANAHMLIVTTKRLWQPDCNLWLLCRVRFLFWKLRKEKYDILLIYHIILMNIFLYVVIFIIGAFFGSFFTLAVYRIPKKEDILIKHSYCPNCSHKLGLFDLSPILSYILLKGKCRYCGYKIRPRYLILELLSGFTFLSIAISTNLSINNINSIISTCFLLLYISVLFIIAGIDKERISIQKNVIVFGYVVEIIYIIYQCTLGNINVYQYVIYLIFLAIILILSNINLKLTAAEKYYIDILYLLLYMAIFYGSEVFILTAILALIIISIYTVIYKAKSKNMPIGFCLCLSNIIVIITSNILINYTI